MPNDTTERDRPSLQMKQPKKKSTKTAPTQSVPMVTTSVHTEENTEARESAPVPQPKSNFAPSTLTSTQNARFLVTCVECGKPRVLYSSQRLSERQKVSLVTTMILILRGLDTLTNEDAVSS